MPCHLSLKTVSKVWVHTTIHLIIAARQSVRMPNGLFLLHVWGCLSLSVFLSVCLSLCLSVCLSFRANENKGISFIFLLKGNSFTHLFFFYPHSFVYFFDDFFFTPIFILPHFFSTFWWFFFTLFFFLPLFWFYSYFFFNFFDDLKKYSRISKKKLGEAERRGPERHYSSRSSAKWDLVMLSRGTIHYYTATLLPPYIFTTSWKRRTRKEKVFGNRLIRICCTLW